MQAGLGRDVFFASGDGWQCLAVLEVGKASSRIYAPYGPHLTKKSALKPALEALRRLAIRHNAMFVRIEPISDVTKTTLSDTGLLPALHDAQPRHTWVKNLAPPEDELIAGMTATNRNLHRTAHKKGLTFRRSHELKDLPIFLEMIHEVAALTGIKPHSDDEFQVIASVLLPRNAAALYFALHEGKPVASALVYDSPTTRYYAHAGSFNEARKLHPGSPLVTRMILDAKASGQQQFDFFGIAPPDEPTHRWAGFSRFKQSFGGEYKTTPGTWEMPIKKLAYTKYRLMLKAHTLIRS